MSEHSLPNTLNFFLSDLVDIREKNGVSLDDIRVRTKVYPHIIAQFEQNGLNEHPLFNVLYLKAFVRSYAEVVGISPGLAAKSYVDALNGVYDRSLAVKYLGHSRLEEETSIKPQVSQSEKLTEEYTGVEESDVALNTNEVIPSEDSINEPVWIESNPNRSNTRTSRSSWNNSAWEKALEFVGNKGILQWSVLAACIVLGGFFWLKLVSSQNEPLTPPLSQESALSVQETSVQNTSENDSSILGLDTLGLSESNQIEAILDGIETQDSLLVTIVADTDKLDPFRVKVDRDLRRPYWLDQNDSLGFWFKDQIIIEDQLDKMEILFKSFTYPISETDSTARVVITRDSVSAFIVSAP